MSPGFIYYFCASLLVVIGLAGVVLPALPGTPLMFAGMLLAAWADDFEHVGWTTLTVLAVFTAASLLVDLLATALGASRVGASRKAVWGAILGSIAGLPYMPIGLFVGPFVGALAGEYWHSRQLRQAAKVGMGTWMGIVLGMAAKLALALSMIGLFAAAWLF
ncbi:DUF456 domain-containing protein [Xanthomonas albilineans]|uniref:DUF456 domain-containing protein n=1 Tax=Xanthomonas albilineans (strain GPE PC73 / CFBP 7063) TaxID=380358 RepID=D2U8C9_XANAP|nr:DUF456 domain-containing protein [Xanthomonas albilineans]PPU92448.1 DUF456 domain-containing protein [Xanthomonas albilineans]QHQ27865.1 hypothetical protein XaFJ1_GM001118 [Xanthomonas albilineans]CBA15645.1 conserved hypothetical protein [Xanthomonas albilineans GPE PC73]